MNGYRLDELYNMIQQTKRKEIQLEKNRFFSGNYRFYYSSDSH